MTSTTRGPSDPLRVALIGYGLAGAVFHAPLIASTPGLRLRAIVTSAEARQARARKDFPEASILPSAEAIWADAAAYDLVVVAATNNVHVSLGQSAIEAGLPVVIDKPLAPSAAAGEALVAASRARGVPLTVFQNRRWDSDYLTLRQLLARDALGPVTRFESRFERYRPEVNTSAWRERAEPEEAGGLLFDLGAHLIDQALQLFGAPQRVYAEVERRRPGAAVDDDTFVALRFPSGVHAHLWMSVNAPLLGPRLRVLGLRGAYEVYGLDPQEDALASGARPGQSAWGMPPRERWGRVATDGTVQEAYEPLPGAYEQFYQRVHAALTTGAPLPVDPADSVAVLRIIEAAQRSAATGQVVEV